MDEKYLDSRECAGFGGFTNPLLNDRYQLSMAYAYFSVGRHNETAVFDLFFRRNPFQGEFTIFAGLSECIRYLKNFRFTELQLKYVSEVMPEVSDEFIDYLRKLRMDGVNVYALNEGKVCFPRVPLMRVEGPLAACQLLETTFLNLVNFASLVCTNAARLRLRAGRDKRLIEFGLRRAQGPNGAMSASRYSYIGGFDATSNMLAGFHFGIATAGTHAHSFVQSFSSLDQLNTRMLRPCPSKDSPEDVPQPRDFLEEVLRTRRNLGYEHTNVGELAAFIAYAQAYPTGFLALVDTYETLSSGVPNFLSVAVALAHFGFTARGIRLDSGDLAYLSKESRRIFQSVGAKAGIDVSGFLITASNDINEETLISLNEQGHSIDVFGIGTHLVTCQAQPALGGVFKLVAIDGVPRIKLSQDIGKVTIPGRKSGYRLIGSRGMPLLDLLMLFDEDPPVAQKRILCRHPFDEAKRVYVTPSKVVNLHHLVWANGAPSRPEKTASELRERAAEHLQSMRPDHMRSLNPTPYKISVSEKLYSFIHSLWMSEAPIAEIS